MEATSIAKYSKQESLVRPEIIPNKEYVNNFMDSRLWEIFEPRDDDIIICSPYKAGTTWLQRICVLVLLDDDCQQRPLSDVSPWLDFRLRNPASTSEMLDSMPHRRIIKTHCPLDGLPIYDSVNYFYIGRDPRDIYVSMYHQLRNMGVSKPLPKTSGKMTIDAGFAMWLTEAGLEGEMDGYPYFSIFNHALSYWRNRHLENLHFFHFSDLKRNLRRETERVLEISGNCPDVTESLLRHAHFDQMKLKADLLAPEIGSNMWRSNADFFRSGELGQWQHELSPASIELYYNVVSERIPTELINWLENGTSIAGDPKGDCRLA